MKTITGTWNYPDGSPVSNGTLYLKLSQDAVAASTAQIAPRVLAITLNGSGQIPANTQIWANDELLPSGTFYRCSVVAVGGSLVWGEDDFSITGISPINLNGLVPVVSAGSPIYSQLQQLALQTNGVPNGSQSKLNLVPGTSITVIDDGVGDVTIASTAPNFVFSPVKKFGMLGVDGANLSPTSFGMVAPSFPNGLGGSASVFNATAGGDPAARENFISNGGAAFSYMVMDFSGGGTPTKWPIQKSLMAATWFRVFDSTTVNATNLYIFPLAFYDISGGNGSNFFSVTGTDPLTAASTARVCAFWGKTNGGTAHWQATCGNNGTLTTVDTGVLIDTNPHVWQIQIVSVNSVKFIIDGNTVATITTNIPASGTLFVPYAWGIQLLTGPAAAQYNVIGSFGYVEGTF